MDQDDQQVQKVGPTWLLVVTTAVMLPKKKILLYVYEYILYNWATIWARF